MPQVQLEIEFRGCSACKKFQGAGPLRVEMYSPEKVHLGWSTLVAITLLVNQSSPTFNFAQRQKSLASAIGQAQEEILP